MFLKRRFDRSGTVPARGPHRWAHARARRMWYCRIARTRLERAGRIRGGRSIADRGTGRHGRAASARPRAERRRRRRWFVGLGAGGQPQQLQVESEFVDAYNASQKDVYIALEIYNNNVAANILKTQIAAGNAPDIIGPVGVEGLNLFRDQLLDLEPIIDRTGYKVDGVAQELVNFFKLGENGATIGVPFAVYPSFLYYNKDLFDEAGLPYPPTKVGEKYDGKDWDLDTLRELGHEADRRQERQRRDQRRLRPRRTSSSGASTCSTRTTALAPRHRLGRRRSSSPTTARRPSSRTPSGPARSGSTTASGRTTSSPAPSRSKRPARQGRRVRVGQPGHERGRTPGSPAASTRPHPAAPKFKNFGFAVAPRQRHDHVASSTPTRSASSTRPRSRTRPSRP